MGVYGRPGSRSEGVASNSKSKLVGAFFFGLMPLACGDIFHSTRDLRSKCDLNPAAAGCESQKPSRPIDGPSVCAASSIAARDAATRTCALLSACEGAFGASAFGTCMVHALLAFDCEANPNRPVRGDLARFWTHLLAAKKCSDVHDALFPGGVPVCKSGSDFTACSPNANGSLTTRVQCRADGVVAGESCLLMGRSCSPNRCLGPALDACKESRCEETKLHICESVGGIDRDFGFDCAYFGAGECVSSTAGAACRAIGSLGAPGHVAAGCRVDFGVTCSRDDIAQGCPSGMAEWVDCGRLFGPGSCRGGAGAAGEYLGVGGACIGAGDLRAADRCDGGALVGHARGFTFKADCLKLGMGRCRAVATLEGDSASCVAAQ